MQQLNKNVQAIQLMNQHVQQNNVVAGRGNKPGAAKSVTTLNRDLIEMEMRKVRKQAQKMQQNIAMQRNAMEVSFYLNSHIQYTCIYLAYGVKSCILILYTHGLINCQRHQMYDKFKPQTAMPAQPIPGAAMPPGAAIRAAPMVPSSSFPIPAATRVPAMTQMQQETASQQAQSAVNVSAAQAQSQVQQQK